MKTSLFQIVPGSLSAAAYASFFSGYFASATTLLARYYFLFSF
jgi:hypothetical protein